MSPPARPRRRPFADFLADRDGAALVEFGLVAPVLALIFIGVAATGIVALKYNAMHTAVSGGAQYVMAGGQIPANVRTVTLDTWRGKTAAAEVSAVKQCRCATTANACSTLCADGSVPRGYITITANDTVDNGFTRVPISTVEEVRIR